MIDSKAQSKVKLLQDEDKFRKEFRSMMNQEIDTAIPTMKRIRSTDIHFGINLFDPTAPMWNFYKMLPCGTPFGIGEKILGYTFPSGASSITDWNRLVRQVAKSGYVLSYSGSRKGFRLQSIDDCHWELLDNVATTVMSVGAGMAGASAVILSRL